MVGLFSFPVKPFRVGGLSCGVGVAGLPLSHVARIPFFRAVEERKALRGGVIPEKL